MPVISRKGRTEWNCKPCSVIFVAPSRIINAITFSDWDRIKLPNDKQVIPYSHLPQIIGSEALSKLAVLKVNGGLGTSMGMIL
jgi:UDP-N-acetylglucosamine pyrophosphorylase